MNLVVQKISHKKEKGQKKAVMWEESIGADLRS